MKGIRSCAQGMIQSKNYILHSVHPKGEAYIIWEQDEDSDEDLNDKSVQNEINISFCYFHMEVNPVTAND